MRSVMTPIPVRIHSGVPEEVTATRGDHENAVKISWKPVKGASGYLIFRSKNISGLYLPLKKVGKETGYVDQSVKPGVYYWYKVHSIRKLSISKPGKKVQGWGRMHMPGGSESLISLIMRLLKSIPHFRKTKSEAIKRQQDLPASTDVTHLVPPNEVIFNWVQELCDPPHRRIGSPESLKAETYLMAEFQRILGKENVFKDQIPCDVYHAEEWGLDIEKNGNMEKVEAFYTVNTGMQQETMPNGGTVSGEMIWAGNGTPEEVEKLGDDLSGKIVVAKCRFPTFPIGLLMKFFDGFYYTSDPKQSLDAKSKRNFTFARKNFPAEYTEEKNKKSIYWLVQERGAEGLILILDNHPGRVNTHWGPYDGKMRSMPCMYVDNYMAAEMKSLAENGSKASLTIKGSLTKGTGQNIYGILPGKSEEVILVSSHHDSPFKGATEDATGVATVLAMAKTWRNIPFEEREKTLVFVSTTGHFYAGKGAHEFAEKHRSGLLKHMIMCINIEHPAAKEFIDDGEGNMVHNGEQAMNFVFVNEDLTSIAAARRMLQQHQPEKAILLQSSLLGAVPPGEAGHYHMYTGVDFIHWIGQPNYILTADDTLDKVDVESLNPIANGIADLIGTYMNLPKR